jgi:hypothetical protein
VAPFPERCALVATNQRTTNVFTANNNERNKVEKEVDVMVPHIRWEKKSQTEMAKNQHVHDDQSIEIG